MSKDNQLRQAVVEELERDPGVIAAHIGVTACSGVVTLTGHVKNFAEKSAIEMAVRRVVGVRAVVEKIEVRLPSHTKQRDDELAATAIERLGLNVSIPRDSVKVQVENWWITLTGEVEADHQAQAAEREVRRVLGVSGVYNHIAIKPVTQISWDI